MKTDKSIVVIPTQYIHTRIQHNTTVRYVVTMDADGSHDPIKIRDLVEALLSVDLSIGSRYV